jgi:hypothetical protein
MTTTEFVAANYGKGGEAREWGGICPACGWLLSGPNAHPDASAQHDESGCRSSDAAPGGAS